MKTFVILLAFLTLAGCSHAASRDGEISTIPVTNNPNALPGSMKSSAMPSLF